VLCVLGIIGWCFIMGMSPLYAVIFFGFTLAMMIFISRVVCELGIMTGTAQEFSLPQYLTAGTLGFRHEAVKLTWGGSRLGFYWQAIKQKLMFMIPSYSTWAFLWPGLFYSVHLMPMVMTSERMFRHGASRRRFTFFLIVLTLGTLVLFSVRSIQIPYDEGAVYLKEGRHVSGTTNHTFNNCLVRDFIQKKRVHEPYDWMYIPAIIGTVVMSTLLVLRHLFYWWPLHPLGYICAGLAGGVWFSVLIGWLVKRAVLKYGGGKLFRQTIPLFVGLLVGHFVIAAIWMIVGAYVEGAGLQAGTEQLYSAIWCQPNGR
jgi:hypothetical protein